MQSSSSVMDISGSDEAGGDRLESSPPASKEKSQSAGFSWPGSCMDATSRKNVTGKLSKRSRKAEEKKTKKQKNSSLTSSDEERKKSKFPLFRRKKARGDKGMGNDAANLEATNSSTASKDKDNDNASLARMCSQTREAKLGAARASPVPQALLTQASDPYVPPSGHRRQGSGASRPSSRSPDRVERSIDMSILPEKGDWRGDYQDYLSATQSKRNGDRFRSGLPEIETTTKSNSIRDDIKKSRRHDHGRKHVRYLRTTEAPSSCAEDILSDLERVSPLVFDASKSIPRRRHSGTKKAREGIVKDTSSMSTGPVVSESTVESSDAGNVYLVRVQF
jgi:hypothetical protein